MKYQRSNNLDMAHNQPQRPHTKTHTKSAEGPHMQGHVLTNRPETTHPELHTPQNPQIDGHTHSQIGQRPLALVHTPTHRSEASAIRHTKHIPRMWTDNQTETSQPRTLYLFLIAVVTNHHNFRVVEKHEFIYYCTFVSVRNPKMGLTVLKSGRNRAVFLPETLGEDSFLPCLFQFPERLYSWPLFPSSTCKALHASSSNLSDFCLHHQSNPWLGLPVHKSFTVHLRSPII